jgi:hypothetical protein
LVDLSITFPSIRNNNLSKVCTAIDKACKQHTYEIIIASPYNMPNDINHFNIKWIKTYMSPTPAWQQCYLLANSEFCIDGSDDALFEENVLDEAISYYKNNNLQKFDIISLILKEGTLNPDTLEELPNAKTHQLHENFFKVRYNLPFHKPAINLDWTLSLNFLIKTTTFKMIGGFDCRFEYANHAIHRFVLSCQANGGIVYTFPRAALLVSHLFEREGTISQCMMHKLDQTQTYSIIYLIISQGKN